MKKQLSAFLLFAFVTTFSQIKNWDVDPYYKEGSDKYFAEFRRAITYVHQDYTVFGKMTFSVFVDDKGVAKIVDVKPKVKNYDLFLTDINYVLRKKNKKWIAAQKDNKPVSSNYTFIINFNTEVYDHD